MESLRLYWKIIEVIYQKWKMLTRATLLLCSTCQRRRKVEITAAWYHKWKRVLFAQIGAHFFRGVARSRSYLWPGRTSGLLIIRNLLLVPSVWILLAWIFHRIVLALYNEMYTTDKLITNHDNKYLLVMRCRRLASFCRRRSYSCCISYFVYTL